MQKFFKQSLCSIIILLVLVQSSFALNRVNLSVEYFANPSIGRALSLANIYVGEVDTDPKVPANQKTISVLQEDGTTVAVTQPITTSSGGIPLYLGSPVTIMVDGSYSLRIDDSSGVQKYYVPKNAELEALSSFDTLAEMRAVTEAPADGDVYTLLGYSSVSDGGGDQFYWDADNVVSDNTFSIIKPTAITTGRFIRIYNPPIQAEKFGVFSDAVDDTTQLRLLLNFGESVIFKSGGTYITDYVSINDVDDIVIYGNGTTLKRLETSTGSDYIRGALLGFGGCNNITVRDLSLDSNRTNLVSATPANVSMNMGIIVFGESTVGSDVLLDNGGEDKGSKNILIDNCKFYRTGSNKAGIDKFGDGIFAFGVDGLTVKNCYFEDMGRWAVAAGDSFNVTIDNNIVDNATTGALATALGSFDIENESADQTNGSYSRAIKITNNKCYGRSSMYNVARASAANENGANHYIKDIEIKNNLIEVDSYATYGTAALYVYITIEGTTYPDYSDAIIDNNIIKSVGSTPLLYGVLIQPETDDTTTSNVSISKNIIKGCAGGIWTDSTQMPILTDYRINNNSIIAEHASTSRGIYCEADGHFNVEVSGNYVRDYGLEGIAVVRNTSSTGLAIVNNNNVYEGLATFTGNGIRVSSDTVRCKDNFVSITTGTDYDLAASVKLIANSRIEDRMIEGALTLSGATGTFTNAIPAGATVVGVSTRVTTAITGATDFDIGIATDTDRYGVARNIALNSTTSNNNWTITAPVMYPANQSIILTANGGNFTAGVVKVVVHYTFVTAPFDL